MRMLALVTPILLAGVLARGEDAPPRWSGEAGLSFVRTTGNSSSSTLGAAFKLWRRDPLWKLGLTTALVRSKADELKTAERLDGALRVERGVGKRFAAYGQASYLRNAFAGIDGQENLEAGGLYKLATGPKHLLSLSGGLAYTSEQRVLPDADRDFAGLRAALAYRWQLGATSDFVENIDYLQSLRNVDDGRLTHRAAVTASLKGVFSMKLEHQLFYLKSPVLGKKQTDTTVLASLVAKWPAPPPPCPCPVK